MRRGAWIIIGAQVVGAACILTTSFDRYDTSIAGVDAAVPDAPPPADAAVPDTRVDADWCPSLVPLPTGADDGTEEKDYVLAVRGLRLERLPEAGPPEPTVGFNVDHTCTCPGPESCVPTASATGNRCDDPGGRDNAAIGVFTAFSTAAPEAFQPGFVRSQIAAGRYTFLLKLQKYNGTPNDSQIVANFLASSGVEGVQTADGGPLRPPTFDGTDVWTVDPVSLLSGSDAIGKDCATDLKACAAEYRDVAAYVTDGVLVAHIDAPLRIGLTVGTFNIDVKGGVLVGKLTRSGDSFSLAGDYAGRLQIGHLLQALTFFREPVLNEFLCPHTPLYKGLKKSLCGALDLRGRSLDDGKGLPCDALSTSLSFEAHPARLGHVWQPPGDAPPCKDASAELDRCD